MLNKLLKYDLKWTLKFLSVFYILGFFFAFLTRVFANIENSLFMNIVSEVFRGATFSMVFSALANNILRLWIKFRQSIYGDEAYLTHTLPVKKGALYTSKILTAIISIFASFIVIISALLIMYYSKANLEWLKNMLLPLLEVFDMSLVGVVILLLLLIFLQFINILQCGYTGMVIGHRFNNAKLGMSILFGFISYMASQIIIVIMLFIPAIFNNDILNLFITTEQINFEVIKPAIIYSIISYTLISIIGFLVNIKLLRKGVNVD